MPVTNALSLRDLRVTTSGRPVLAGLSLDVPVGEAVALLSAPRSAAVSAASLALRAACGLAELASGTVLAAGRNVTRLPPHRRGLPLIGGGPAPLGNASAVVAIREAARGVDIAPVVDACLRRDEHAIRVGDLPEAARRRVALAQAVATGPACLLVDEPAAGLPPDDAAELFAALRQIREGGIAMLIATSDPATAFAVADRGVALGDGAARQAGWLRDLHDSPADDVTASLLGPINRLAGEVVDEEDDLVTVRLACGPLVEARREDAAVGTDCVVCVRPGRVAMASVSAESIAPSALPGRVQEVWFQGDVVRLTLEIGTKGGHRPAVVSVSRPAILPLTVTVGEIVALGWQPHHAMAFRPLRGR